MSGDVAVGSLVHAIRGLLDKLPSHSYVDLPLYMLKRKLFTVSEMLAEAEEKQLSDPEMEQWLKELVDVLYVLEDLLDKTATEALLCKLEVKSQINKTQVMSAPFLVDKRANKITERLTKEKTEHIPREKEGQKAYLPLSMGCHEDECSVFGRDEDKEAIINLLLSENVTANKIDVIPIVGEGGVGKTTLAQLVYNDVRVKRFFDFELWVSVQEDFDVMQVTKAFLQALASYPRDVDDLYYLQLRLKGLLRMKKILLVLDDVRCWDYSIRQTVRLPLLAGANEGKVIMTTRSLTVAASMGTLPAYHLKRLSYEDCWMLFAKHAFADETSHLHPKHEALGREIVKKCYGLPLAAKILGSVLRFKPSVEEWHTGGIFLPTLMLSYHYLPIPLKRCFAYCSIFPKDHEFEEEKLIRLWMAEGLLQQRENRRMEDVGHEDFLGLLSMSFFQRSSANKLRFVMHDVVNDLAQYLSGDRCSRLVNHEPVQVHAKTRHLSFSGGKFNAEICSAICQAKYLRTLLLCKLPQQKGPCQISGEVLENLLEALQYIRVLSLSHYYITELPDSVGRLKHLRYLDLSYTAITRLPDSVGALNKLQTLILSNCRSLTKLPASMANLVNLSHLDIGGTDLEEMPREMAKLTNLPKWSNFIKRKYRDSRRNKNFQALFDLQVLQGKYWQCCNTTVGPQNEREVFRPLQLRNTTPPVMLRYRSLPPIVRLNLRHLGFSDVSLLGQQPSLKFLGGFEKIEELRMVGPQGMPKLQKLIFPEVGGWEFPVQGCCKLEGSIPALSPSNTRVEISECPKLELKFPRKHYLFLNDGNKLLPRRYKELVDTLSQLPVIEEMPLLPGSKGVEQSSDDEVPSKYFKTEDSTTSESFPPESSVLSSIESEEASPIPLHKTEMPIVRSETDDPINKRDTEDSLQDISSSISLKVSEMSQLMELPPGLCSLKIKGCDALKSLPEPVHSNPCLRHLYIIDCCFFKSFHGGHPPIALKTLYIRNCRKLELFSPAEAIPQSLLIENLCIGSSCDSLTSFPLALFPKLRSFVIWDSENFSSIFVDKEHMSLDTLEIRDCHKLVSFPKGGLRTPNLTSIVLSNCKNLQVLPDQLHRLESLRSLFINECPELILIPEGGFPDNLDVLCISSCLNLTPSIAWGLHKLENLCRFEIEGGCRDLESFPKQKLLPDNLNSLRISRLPNLKFLDYKGLQHLTSLETLQINCCRKLRSLPEEGLPSSLTSLYVSECSLLKAKIQNKKGFDWYNIAHIPYIQIDEDIIS